MSNHKKTESEEDDEGDDVSFEDEDNLKPINLRQPSTGEKVITSLLAGGIAGAIAKTTIAPLDRTKINFQISSTNPFSTRSAIKFIIKSYKTEGFFSLWRGNSATMARIIPYAAIQFSAHEQWKNILGENGPGSGSNIRRFLAGSLAGVTAQTLTYPLDLARARLAVAKKSHYSSLLDVLKKIVKEEGVRSLYKGYSPTILGVIPYAGFSFYTYETCKKFHFEKYGPDIAISPPERLLFGAFAGVVGQTSSYPLDIIRRRMQVAYLNGEAYVGVWASLCRVYNKEGLKGGLYKGLSMNWIKGPVAAGISFTVFDLLQHFFRHGGPP